MKCPLELRGRKPLEKLQHCFLPLRLGRAAVSCITALTERYEQGPASSGSNSRQAPHLTPSNETREPSASSPFIQSYPDRPPALMDLLQKHTGQWRGATGGRTARHPPPPPLHNCSLSTPIYPRCDSPRHPRLPLLISDQRHQETAAMIHRHGASRCPTRLCQLSHVMQGLIAIMQENDACHHLSPCTSAVNADPFDVMEMESCPGPKSNA